MKLGNSVSNLVRNSTQDFIHRPMDYSTWVFVSSVVKHSIHEVVNTPVRILISRAYYQILNKTRV